MHALMIFWGYLFQNKKKISVQVIPPAVGNDEVGFASYVGEFDSFLDTAQDERPARRFLMTANTNRDDDDDDLDDDEEEDEEEMVDRISGTTATLQLLKQWHKCECYISSLTKSQNIVIKKSVFFGPGKAKKYI